MPDTELGRLIQEWLDKEPSRRIADLARAGQFPHRNTLYELLKRDPKEAPRRRTLERLAHGLGLPYAVVRDAAYRDAGQRVREEPTVDPAVTVLVDALDEASARAREAAVKAAMDVVRAIDGTL